MRTITGSSTPVVETKDVMLNMPLLAIDKKNPDFCGFSHYGKVGVIKLTIPESLSFIWSVFCGLSLPENYPRGVVYTLQHEPSPHRVCVQTPCLLVFMPSVCAHVCARARVCIDLVAAAFHSTTEKKNCHRSHLRITENFYSTFIVKSPSE